MRFSHKTAAGSPPLGASLTPPDTGSPRALGSVWADRPVPRIWPLRTNARARLWPFPDMQLQPPARGTASEKALPACANRYCEHLSVPRSPQGHALPTWVVLLARSLFEGAPSAELKCELCPRAQGGCQVPHTGSTYVSVHKHACARYYMGRLLTGRGWAIPWGGGRGREGRSPCVLL